jgi:DNA-binding NtrC family response regulator
MTFKEINTMKKRILIVEDEFAVAYQLQSILESAGYEVCGIAVSVPKALVLVDAHNPGLVLLDIHLKGDVNGIHLAHTLNHKHIPFIYLSANSNESILKEARSTKPYGFLVKPFREKDLLVAIDIALYRHENSLELKHQQLAVVERYLKQIAEAHTGHDSEFAEVMQEVIPFDYLTAFVNQDGTWRIRDCGFLRVHFKEYQQHGLDELSNISGLSISELRQLALSNVALNTPSLYIADSFSAVAGNSSLLNFFASVFNLKSLLFQPLLMSDGSVIALCFFGKSESLYSFDHLDTLTALRRFLEPATEKVCKGSIHQHTQHRTLPSGKGKVSVNTFHGVIGQSSSLLTVFDHVKKVAARDTSVLILGENGTGKEKIARAIHELSLRSSMQIITVNCASLPPDLIESELFGHEKGAFTGASEKRIGKFEQASGGTIFLDEIGEMPLSAQVKLLRVLQQREIERVGGKSPVAVDIRIIAATNRNLEKEVADGKFRMDLYYRLNVFPITLPPLRERKDDIPLLVEHFLKEHAAKMSREPYQITDYGMQQLLGYDWPGNVRELENFIERTIVLASGRVIDNIYLPGAPVNRSAAPSGKVRTIEEIEKDHIIQVLKKCNSKIYGPGGAAEMLNIPPTTLSSKIKKLGILKDLIN